MLLIVLLIALTILNPSFAEPGQFMRFVQRVSPVAIVAIGQYFVIVCGEFDLSMGALVTAQVIIAGNLIQQDDSKIVPVLVFMGLFGAMVGLVNGLVTTLLAVPSFIVTLGMLLVLRGSTLFWTGGAPIDNASDTFREIGRGGIKGIPVLDFLPWAVVIFAVVFLAAAFFTRSPFGRTIIAVGDNLTTARYSGTRVWWVKTVAFVISSLSATIAGVLLAGFAGSRLTVGLGYEFIAITAVVLGGVVLGGGRGILLGAVAGAFALEALFGVLNFANVPATYRDAVQGVIIIAAVALASVTVRRRRTSTQPQASPETEKEPAPTSSPAHPASQDIPTNGG